MIGVHFVGTFRRLHTFCPTAPLLLNRAVLRGGITQYSGLSLKSYFLISTGNNMSEEQKQMSDSILYSGRRSLLQEEAAAVRKKRT